MPLKVYEAISFLNCSYYAERAGLIEDEKNLPEEERTKLHVNTKRPTHSDPDMIYTVIGFIDFDKYLPDERKEEIYRERPDIGVIVVSSELKRRHLIKTKSHVSQLSNLQGRIQFLKIKNLCHAL